MQAVFTKFTQNSHKFSKNDDFCTFYVEDEFLVVIYF